MTNSVSGAGASLCAHAPSPARRLIMQKNRNLFIVDLVLSKSIA
jgi:hypothetical protein